MNPTKQFWTLFKFQLTVNPSIWFMTLAFSMPLLFSLQIPGQILDLLIPARSLFFVAFLGVFILAPEILYPANQWPGFGPEFLLTRAVDRNILTRARAALFYLLVLVVPIGILLFSLRQPNLQATTYSKILQQECLDHLTGSTLSKDGHGYFYHLSIPYGNVLLAAWHTWEFLLCAIATQMLLHIIYPFKYRRYILPFFALALILGIFAEIFFHQSLSPADRLFFSFASHPVLLGTAGILAVILTQLWCERRFTRMEQ
jgi:hypothetical protein